MFTSIKKLIDSFILNKLAKGISWAGSCEVRFQGAHSMRAIRRNSLEQGSPKHCFAILPRLVLHNTRIFYQLPGFKLNCCLMCLSQSASASVLQGKLTTVMHCEGTNFLRLTVMKKQQSGMATAEKLLFQMASCLHVCIVPNMLLKNIFLFFFHFANSNLATRKLSNCLTQAIDINANKYSTSKQETLKDYLIARTVFQSCSKNQESKTHFSLQ